MRTAGVEPVGVETLGRARAGEHRAPRTTTVALTLGAVVLLMTTGTAVAEVIAGDGVGGTMDAPIGAGTIWPLVVAAAAALSLFVLIRGWRLPDARSVDELPPFLLAALAVTMMFAAPLGVTAAMALIDATASPTGDPQATGIEIGDSTLRVQGISMIGAYAAQLIVIAAWWRARRRNRRTVADSVRSVSRWSAIGIGVLTVVIAWPIVALVFAAVAKVRFELAGEPTERLAHETLQALDEGSGAWAVVVTLLAAVAAPAIEEVLFRGMLQPCLRGIGAGPWTAIVLVSALFAAVHWTAVPPPGVAALFVLGLAFGWARERTGGLLAPILAHALFNAGNLLLASA